MASNLPTHRALIEHGVNGMIYNSRSDPASYLEQLISAPEMARRLGAAARQMASGHTWANVAEWVARAYESSIDESKN